MKQSFLDKIRAVLPTFLPQLVFLTILVGVVLLLAVTNYVPDTWLSGWDNLHWEFNFGLSFDRLFNGVWQEYQALGLHGIMAHMADLPRLVLLLVMNVVVPLHDLRYVYMFLCLLVGTLGVYWLMLWLLRNIPTKKENPLNIPARSLAFIAALFYILNLGTLQNFYAPFEVFPTMWAFLPWLFLYFIKTVRHCTTKNLLIFSVLNILAMPMFYVPTLFIVYVLSLVALSITTLVRAIKRKRTNQLFRRYALLGLTILLVNSIWLIPAVYGLYQQRADTVIEAKINQMSSADAYQMNQNRGTAGDISILKGFWFDNVDHNIEIGEFEPMFQTWDEYLSIPAITFCVYLFFGVVILGILYSLRVKAPFVISFIILFIFCWILLLGDNPPFGQLVEALRNFVPLFKQAFRFPFTKISPLLTLVYAVFFGFGMLAIVQWLKRWLKHAALPISIFIAALFLTVGMFPMFAGNLISKQLQVEIPEAYFEMFDWFEKQPSMARVANLPQHTFWSWNFYNWGYRGSGFLWYGIKQPLMDRAFDVWNYEGEQYYNEMSQAIYSLNVEQIKQVMNKYQIGWFLYDRSVDVVLDARHVDLYEKSLLPQLIKDKDFDLAQNFDEQLLVIAYKPLVDSSKPVMPLFPKAVVDQTHLNTYRDFNYLEGAYVSGSDKSTALILPNQDLNGIAQIDTSKGQIELLLSQNMPGRLGFKDYWKYEKYLPAKTYARRASERKVEVKLEYILPEIYQADQKIFPTSPITEIVELPAGEYKMGNRLGYVDLRELTDRFEPKGTVIVSDDHILNAYRTDRGSAKDYTKVFATAEFGHCSDTKDRLNSSVERVSSESGIELTAKKAIGCMYTDTTPSFPQSFLLSVEFDYLPLTSQANPLICVIEYASHTCVNPPISMPQNIQVGRKGKFTQMVPVNSRNFTGSSLQLQLYAYDSDGSETIVYNNIQVGFLPLETQVKLQKAGLKELSDTNTTVAGEPIRIIYPTISLSTSQIDLGDEHLSTPPVRSWPRAQTVPGVVSKVADPNSDKVTYFAQDNEAYNVFGHFYVPSDANFLFGIASANLSGLPLQVCINNAFYYRCTLEFRLPAERQSKQYFRILPAQAKSSDPMEIKLSTISYNNNFSVNEVRNVGLHMFPAQFLMSARVNETDGENGEELLAQDRQTPLRVRKIEQYSPWLYYVVADGRGYLHLPQTFAPGWKISVPAEHVVANGWANAWKLDLDGSTQILIYYCPQYLQFLGMSLGLLWIVGLVVFVFKETRDKS